MKLRHIVIAGAACSLGSVAWAQQSPQDAQQSPQQSQAMEQQMQMGGEQHAQDPEVIRQVQKSLNDQGYDAGPVDGKWGPKTQAAVKNFQQAKGLDATGSLNEETLAELDVEAPATGAAGAGPGGEQRSDQPSGQQEPQSGKSQ